MRWECGERVSSAGDAFSTCFFFFFSNCKTEWDEVGDLSQEPSGVIAPVVGDDVLQMCIRAAPSSSEQCGGKTVEW